MNGRKAKYIRKALGIKKPTPLDRGGIRVHESGVAYFHAASNPVMNNYRRVKRAMTRIRQS